MKYIEAKKIKSEIKRIKKWVEENDVSDDYKTGLAFGLIALDKFIDKYAQKTPTTRKKIIVN